MERTNIVASRCRFLRAVIKEKIEDIVWLDETWLNAGHTVSKGWTDDSTSGSMAVPIGKGSRIIILHSGTSSGFVPNSLLEFKSKKTGDYHEDMNQDVFLKWFKYQLLENIKKNSVIVMDNAPYHSVIIDKAPTTASRKQEIIDWLVQHDVVVQNDLKKQSCFN